MGLLPPSQPRSDPHHRNDRRSYGPFDFLVQPPRLGLANELMVRIGRSHLEPPRSILRLLEGPELLLAVRHRMFCPVPLRDRSGGSGCGVCPPTKGHDSSHPTGGLHLLQLVFRGRVLLLWLLLASVGLPPRLTPRELLGEALNDSPREGAVGGVVVGGAARDGATLRGVQGIDIANEGLAPDGIR